MVDGDPGEGDATVRRIDGHPFAPFQVVGEPQLLSAVRLLAPVLPSKVVAVGRNYADHVKEMGGEVDLDEPPVVFLKPSTSVVGPGDPVQYPVGVSDDVHYEGELAIVIARLCREVPVDRVRDVVLGFTCANDVTARDLQKTEKQWGRAKGFDTFCPLGPWIVTPDAIPDPHDLRMELRVNGEVRQESHSRNMSVTIPAILSNFSGLGYSAGDVLSTGTVSGVAGFKSPEERARLYLKPGDVIEAEIERIGVLRNQVVSWQEGHGTQPPPRVRPWGEDV